MFFGSLPRVLGPVLAVALELWPAQVEALLEVELFRSVCMCRRFNCLQDSPVFKVKFLKIILSQCYLGMVPEAQFWQ